MASIKLILRADKVGKTGEAPLFIRVIKDRKTKFISLGVRLHPNEWDEDKQRVKKNHSNSARINALLAHKVAEAEGQVADLERRNVQPSAKKLKEAIKGKPAVNFFEYAYSRCERIKANVSVRSYKSYLNYIKKFETFAATKEVYFDDITVTTLKDYVAYMGNVLKNGPTTQHYSLMILAIMFKDAQREEIIPETLFPFNKVKVRKEKGKRLFLNKEQLEALAALDVNPAGKAGIYRDMFLFAVYAGGLRFSDVVELQHKHFIEDELRIKKVIRKTGRLHQFKIGSYALDIINKYRKPGATPEDFIFPAIEEQNYFQLPDEVQYKIIDRANHLSSWHLTRLGKELKLPFQLSFHLSRHTFATRALNNGMRIEHVSKLLDHQDIGTTQIYAKIINEELDKAVEMYVN